MTVLYIFRQADPQTYEGKNTAISMAEDAYANYVLRTSLDVLEDNSPLKERLFSMLLLNMEDLERSPFAKQVVLRVKTCTGLKSHLDMREGFDSLRIHSAIDRSG